MTHFDALFSYYSAIHTAEGLALERGGLALVGVDVKWICAVEQMRPG